MRDKHRIEPFLRRVDVGLLIAITGKFKKPEKALEYQKSLEDFIATPAFVTKWLDNPDLRFGQYLFNEGIELFDYFYNHEEPDLLELCGYSKVESTIWGSNFDSKGKQLKEPVYRFIDELDDYHLRIMITEANMKERLYSPDMLKLFEQELCNRGFCNITVSKEAIKYMKESFRVLEQRRLFDMITLLSSIR